MKTLVITNDYSPKKGGISTYIQSFCRNLNFETYIYAPNWAEGENVINSKYNFIFSGKKFFREINDIVNQKDIEIIIHASSNPQFLLVNQLAKIDCKQYMIIHGAEFNIINSIPLIKNVMRRSFNALEKIFTVSFFTARKLEDITETEVVLIGAGVESNEFSKEYKKNDKLTIGVSSRFVSRKKIDWVIDALHELKMDGMNVDLKIFGFGKLEKYLRKLSDISSQNIEFYHDENEESLTSFYKEIDLFAMPAKSRFFGKEFEGLGLVYLEAGSFGLPILVGSSGGAFETIIPGKTGFIVGSKRDIYDGVKYFYDNPEEVESFGKRSRDFVTSNFSWEKTINKFISAI
jgi:phosphatidylinositol alpha-1,6-mannosyltransferase